ncbi:unnamed protein product [Cyprideis torosa]|uniref:Uncharacterized protein n=1 Tax=Cyprideis torosa TaxID=163714 RepID=A0A7R8WAD1_9CRUS|nr:unnamed protein product [Cyprideis torosa]CAG0889518.1 unnamed protein product [Cyprideis torosa]
MATAATSKPVDMELRKAFTELQIKMQDHRQNLRILENQLEVVKRGIQHAKLTDTELESLPKETVMYEGVGRMFVKTSKEEVRDTLSQKINSSEDKARQIEKQREHIQKKMKDEENSIRELVAAKRDS